MSYNSGRDPTELSSAARTPILIQRFSCQISSPELRNRKVQAWDDLCNRTYRMFSNNYLKIALNSDLRLIC
jgi:hypothetical protein